MNKYNLYKSVSPNVLIIVAVIVAYVFLPYFGLLPQRGTYSAAASGERVAVHGTLVLVDSFDSHDANVDAAIGIHHIVYDPLVQIDSYDKIHPMLATSWSYNEDNTELTLNLRKGVHFHNGTIFNADVVKQNLDHVLLNGYPDVQQELMGLESVEVVDEYTVLLKLLRPDLTTLIRLAGRAGTIIEPSTLGQKDANQEPIGTGPFILNTSKSDKATRHWVFDANPSYWDPDAVQLDRFESIGISDVAVRTNALLAGTLDSSYVLPNDMPYLEEDDSLVMAKAPGFVGGIQIVDAKGLRVPQLAQKEVRCAIAQAFDRSYIAEHVWKELANHENQFVAAGQYGYSDNPRALQYNPMAAKAIIDKIGPFELSAGNPRSMRNLANYVVPSLAEIGIALTIDDIPQSEIYPSLAAGRYPIKIAAFGFDHPQHLIEHRGLVGSYYNPSGFIPEGVDELYLQIASGDLTAEEAEPVYAEIVARMMDECVWIPMVVASNTIVHHPHLVNVRPTNVLGGIEVRGLSLASQVN